MQVTGYPTPEDIDSMKSPFAATMLESLPKTRPKPLAEMFPRASADALDLLRLCFQFNPGRRITAKEALRHPFVVQFHNPDDEMDCDRTIRIPVDDNTKLRVEDYRNQIYEQVLRKKKEQRRSHRRVIEQQQMQAQAAAQQQQHMQAAQYQPQRNSVSAPQHSSGMTRHSGHSGASGAYRPSSGASNGSYGVSHQYHSSQQAPVQYQDAQQRVGSAASYTKSSSKSPSQATRTTHSSGMTGSPIRAY